MTGAPRYLHIAADAIALAARCAFARLGRGGTDDDHAEVAALMDLRELLPRHRDEPVIASCPVCFGEVYRTVDPTPTVFHRDTDGCGLLQAIVAAVDFAAAPPAVRH